MRTGMTIAAIFALCALGLLAQAQTQPTPDLCPPGETGLGVCPPTGTSMGQSDYQRATHEEKTAPSATGTAPPPMPELSTTEPAPATESAPYIEPSGAGAELYETTPLPNSITVDDEFVYVLRGDQVVKLTKKDMKVVSITTLPPSSAK